MLVMVLIGRNVETIFRDFSLSKKNRDLIGQRPFWSEKSPSRQFKVSRLCNFRRHFLNWIA